MPSINFLPMKVKNLLVSLVIVFCFFPNSALAETVVDLDVVVNTTWAKEMSPIIIKSSSRNDKIRRVTAGAVLTIEPGVVVKFDSGMSLHITSQCLRGYGSEACYRGRTGEIKMPKLIAKGTSVEPIIFTSDQNVPQAGNWGSVIVDARGSVIEWAEFRYGGMRSKRAFVEINNSVFKNNLIEDGGQADSALWASSQTIEGNVIRKNGGDAIFCNHQCEIKDNFITENSGDALELETLLETKITGNFIYQNSGFGISNKNILSIPVTAEGNFFRENTGGIYSHRSHKGCKFNNNNFLKNKDFAIKSDINNRAGKIYEAISNWFGIDTGATSTAGQFFVSLDYDVSKFAKEGNDFAISGGSRAARAYRDYLSVNNLEGAFFTAKTQRSSFIGNANLPGSLLKYSVTLGNRTTKARNGMKLSVSMPGDQSLLLCSVQPATPSFNYSLQTACTTSLPGGVTFENNQLIWRPASIAALEEQTLFFVMMIKPTASATASFPRLDFNGKPFSYRAGSSVQLKEGGGGAPQVSQPVAQTNPAPAPVAAPAPAPAPVIVNGGLATGTVSRQIINGVLNYVLSATDGKHYILYNKWKWRDIDNFTKGADKNKPISVYGEFYYNRYGVATGIKFTRFEVR